MRRYAPIMARTQRYKSSFFPQCVFKWRTLDNKILTSPTLISLKKCLLQYIRPSSSNICKIHYPIGLKLLTRLRIGLSHLGPHKFNYNFNETLDPFCVLCANNSCETLEHFLLHCSAFSNPVNTFLAAFKR